VNIFDIQRELCKKIMAFTDTPFVKVITGVRRSGKSTIMGMIMDELKKKAYRIT